jgi:short-subunit dehydrogenase
MAGEGKYALVTGATSGIGREIAKLLAKDGYNLIIVGRNQDELNNTSNELKVDSGINIHTTVKDLFKNEEVFALCDEVSSLGVQVDVLVNDAGQGVYGLFKDNDIKRELDIINLNVDAMVILTKHFVNEMTARRQGRILNLGSIAGKMPGPWQAVYHATKAFVLSFTAAVREEVKDTGVTLTALLPGVTDTDFFNKAGMNESRMVEDESSKADPAVVAKDGYEAMMAGEARVISGFKNVAMVEMSNMMPDSTVAHNMYEMQKPVEHE